MFWLHNYNYPQKLHKVKAAFGSLQWLRTLEGGLWVFAMAKAALGRPLGLCNG